MRYSFHELHVQVPGLHSVEQQTALPLANPDQEMFDDALPLCDALAHAIKPDAQTLALCAPKHPDPFKTMVVIDVVFEILCAYAQVLLQRVLLEDFRKVHGLLAFIPPAALGNVLQRVDRLHDTARRLQRGLIVSYIPKELVDVSLYIPPLVIPPYFLQNLNQVLLLHEEAAVLRAAHFTQNVRRQFQDWVRLALDLGELAAILSRKPLRGDGDDGL